MSLAHPAYADLAPSRRRLEAPAPRPRLRPAAPGIGQRQTVAPVMSGMMRHGSRRQVRLDNRTLSGLVCRKEAAVLLPAPEPLAFSDTGQGSEVRLAVEPEPQNVNGVHPAAVTPESDDQEPIVILDHPAEVAALPESSSPAPRAPVTVSLLARLVAYAQGRLQAGFGIDLLQAAELAVPQLDLFGAGVVPAGYRQALTPTEAASLGDLDLTDALLLPAVDAAGTIVDAVCWRLGGSSPSCCGSLQPIPTGTLVPRLPPTDATTTVCTDLGDLARRLSAGERHVLLLRPDREVVDQLRDLHARGLRAVRADQPDLATACAAVGITVVAAPTDAAWQVVAVDRDHRRVVLASDSWSASLSIPAPGSSQVRVDVRTDDGRQQGDTIDSAAARQVQAFAMLAARKLQVPAALVQALLAEGLADRLRAWAAEPGHTTPVMPDQSVSGDLEAVLTDPTIIGRFHADADTLGWVGDAQAKTLALLTLAGLGLDHPPWLIVQGDPAITLPITGLLADLVPADRRVLLTRGTEGGLTSQGPEGLRHRLLVVHAAPELKAATVTALQVLRARGGLALPVSHRDAATGRMVSRLQEAQGPVGLLAAASDASPLDDLAVVVCPDDSSAQTERVLTRARRLAQVGVDAAAMAAVRARWQGVLASIPRLPVRIPAADRVQFPSRHARHRVEHEQFVALVEASALLHHRQRAQVDGCLIATEADITLVIEATRGLLGRTDDGLSERARQLVALLAAQPDRSITIPQLSEAMPHWTRDIARTVLDELLRAQVVAGPSTGRGRKARPFVLTRMPSPDERGIQLLPTSTAPPARNWGSAPISIPNISRVGPVDYAILGNWGHDRAGRSACAS
jgi:hypothetical protein